MSTYIMSGPPGSGKSHAARELAMSLLEAGEDGVIISADHYFYGWSSKVDIYKGLNFRMGTLPMSDYKFDPGKIGEAHAMCRQAFRKALVDNVAHIIIDNTNILAAEKAVYYDHASDYGMMVQIVRMESGIDWCLGRNTHGVPDERIREMHYMHHARNDQGRLRETMPWWNTVSKS